MVREGKYQVCIGAAMALVRCEASNEGDSRRRLKLELSADLTPETGLGELPELRCGYMHLCFAPCTLHWGCESKLETGSGGPQDVDISDVIRWE
jgi:hypothetical protein